MKHYKKFYYNVFLHRHNKKDFAIAHQRNIAVKFEEFLICLRTKSAI